MPEQKKRGFGALERRIHELEEEDRKREQEAAGEAQGGARKEPAEEQKPRKS